MTVEQAPYTVVKTDGAFELRDYAPHLVAETVVVGSLEGAGNRAFDPLFRYISGANHSRRKLAMTAPVSQHSEGERIAMTAPVSQREAGEHAALTARAAVEAPGGRWAVAFTMPAAYTMETLPVPDDPRVVLREVPARRAAAVRYSGTWSEKGYKRHLQELGTWIEKQGLTAAGEPEWARYDAPFIPWFMRRNEILIAVQIHAPEERVVV